jgi:hypothetical protein
MYEKVYLQISSDVVQSSLSGLLRDTYEDARNKFGK